jgi:hypothetical protein
MKFNPTQLAVPQSDGGDSLELPPSAATIRLSQDDRTLTPGPAAIVSICWIVPTSSNRTLRSSLEILRGIKAGARRPLGEPDRRVNDTGAESTSS